MPPAPIAHPAGCRVASRRPPSLGVRRSQKWTRRRTQLPRFQSVGWSLRFRRRLGGQSWTRRRRSPRLQSEPPIDSSGRPSPSRTEEATDPFPFLAATGRKDKRPSDRRLPHAPRSRSWRPGLGGPPGTLTNVSTWPADGGQAPPRWAMLKHARPACSDVSLASWRRSPGRTGIARAAAFIERAAATTRIPRWRRRRDRAQLTNFAGRRAVTSADIIGR